jgi:predicted RND superfamily exporter protein
MNLPALLGDVIGRRYRLVTALSLLLVFVAAAGAARLTFNADFRAYFSDDNPQLLAFEALEDDFNKRDTLVMLVEVHEGSVFTAPVLNLVRELTNVGWTLPFSRRVDSLASFQHLSADADGITARNLIDNDLQLDAASVANIREIALGEETLRRLLIAENETVTAISIALQLPDNDPNATRELVKRARSEVAALAEPHADQLTVHLFGTSIINLALEEAVARDMSMLIPLSTLLIYVLVFVMLRSLGALLIVFSAISLSTAMVFGLFGWLNVPLSPAIGIVPSMIMVIAVADAVHLLVTFQQQLATGRERIAAMQEALRINFAPMLITSITTAIGLLCLNFSEAPPYRALGNMGAAGAIAAFILTITLVPALLCWLPPGRGVQSGRGASRLFAPMEKLADFVIRRRHVILLAALASVIILVPGVPQNTLSERWHEYYDESFAVRRALDVQDANLNGVNFIEYRIASASEQGVNAPEFLQELAALHDWMSTHSAIVQVDGILPRLQKVHRLLETGAGQPTELPDTSERAAQNMLLYEMSLPLGLGIEEYISADRQSTRMTVSLSRTDSSALIALDEQIRSWVGENAPALQIDEGTGLDMVFAHISERNMASLLQGTALALVLISALLMLILRSVRIGLLSLVPNLIPILAAYGLWGYTVGRIDLGLSVIACMALGLVVDDTVHFLSKYQRARREQNMLPEQAVRYAFSTVGVAMLVTTVVLTLGFAILMFSPFSPSWGMGALLSTSIALALVYDFLLLPPLLIAVDR